ncbi:flagellar FliL protein [Thiohalospira halophila DSM 15071]|uniref:Flagellar protein FliL n=1 Tax=Thiohalospira halophila DSM 15071 TaxID=1123397 RepID=A0A1I1PFY8_9GAMM|nr:flagellar basal body-associated FliL family protein [Thiohalospira halophila]SFD08771.1 flagellar FliL protein [Thiohalospira halophila DSM 15071]
MAKKEVDVDVGNGGGGGMSTGKLVIILVAAQVVLIGGLVAALWFAGVFGGGGSSGGGGEAEQAQESQETHYIEMGDPFTVNVNGGGARFMQVGIQVMSRDPKAGDAVETHMPVIRDRINTILGSQNAEQVRTTEGKQQLRKAILEDMRKVLEERYGKPAIEEVYFTKFVIQ